MKKDFETLNAKRLENKNNHTCEVTEEDYERIKPKIELLKSLSEIERSIYAIYDMNRQNYLLKSEEQKRIMGINDSDNSNADLLELHYELIHPEDLPFVLETDNMVYQFYAKLPASKKKDYKLVYNYRTRNMEGIYLHLMHQSVILEQDKNGKGWLVLVISNLLADKGKTEKPQRKMINMKTGKLHLFNTIDNEPSSEKILSKRETEILSLIGRGYDSINISDKLNISVNTVNNHRQNILRKTKSDNTTQSLLYCKRIGLI